MSSPVAGRRSARGRKVSRNCRKHASSPALEGVLVEGWIGQYAVSEQGTVVYVPGKFLNAELDMARKLDNNPIETGTITIERQCDVEYLEDLDDQVEGYDAILSMACRFPDAESSRQIPVKKTTSFPEARCNWDSAVGRSRPGSGRRCRP